MLSLVIDVGYARITQAQMQNAADGAALEGLRKRNIGVVNPATGQTVDDSFAGDCLRRSAAHRVVGWTFDDDLNIADGDPAQYGAGPIIDLTDGVTSLHALQTMSVPDVHVYKPDLQINQQNAVHGDMVSGRFCYSADPPTCEGAGHVTTRTRRRPKRARTGVPTLSCAPSRSTGTASTRETTSTRIWQRRSPRLDLPPVRRPTIRRPIRGRSAARAR